MSPFTLTLPFRAPMRPAQSCSKGTTLAKGFPCFVMRSPSGSSLSSKDRHRCLKSEILIVFIPEGYNWTFYLSSHLFCPLTISRDASWLKRLFLPALRDREL